MSKSREEKRDYILECMGGAANALANRNPLIELGIENAKDILIYGMEELEQLYIEEKTEKEE